MIRRVINALRRRWENYKQQRTLASYLQERIPWSAGYHTHKWQVIQQTLRDKSLCARFAQGESLPDAYGYGVDERVVEYPWLFGHLHTHDNKNMLDAGSALNFAPLVDNEAIADDLTIFTLSPESHAYWQRGISYHYGDLRHSPFQDAWFDTITCISTLEHVGMSNDLYGFVDDAPTNQPESFVQAATELWRMLKPGGTLYITVPFGQFQLIEWKNEPLAQQFDSQRIEQLTDVFTNGSIEKTFFHYDKNGWHTSTEAACQDATYFNIHQQATPDDDHAAAARAVCCLRVVKPATL